MAGGDITKADGDVSGRKFVVGAKSNSDVTATATGTGTHVALIDTVNSVLLFVATCPSVSIISGNPTSIVAFQNEVRARPRARNKNR